MGVSGLHVFLNNLEHDFVEDGKILQHKIKEILASLYFSPALFITLVGYRYVPIIEKYYEVYYSVEVPIGYGKDPQIHMLLKNNYSNSHHKTDTRNIKVNIPSPPSINLDDYIPKSKIKQVVNFGYKTKTGMEKKLKTFLE
jgi:hypothetical protein